ncbi:YdeI/OmpD-associated family protein [Modestobacter marinus]|uniref:YdeI/OmpD-associated family protein n=1 Tax=Modestobacter marinus TaxID=477641 RepID=UPI001C957A7B|nr:YdeI/OmpD-associated family protein [Modestobacter marinus]
MRFSTTVVLGGKTATGLEVPAEVVTALGAGKRPPVTVSVGGHTYRSTVAPMAGSYWLPLAAEHRTAAGVAAGDTVEVDVELDEAPRVVEVPADLTAALDAEPEARRRFDALSYSNQRRHVLAVEGAKAEATRARRVAAAVATLREG